MFSSIVGLSTEDCNLKPSLFGGRRWSGNFRESVGTKGVVWNLIEDRDSQWGCDFGELEGYEETTENDDLIAGTAIARRSGKLSK